MAACEIRHYCTAGGLDVFARWFDGLRDPGAKERIAVRIDRLALGLFGDMKPLREGVCELRVDHGPGYRIYFARADRNVILLLCGGDKRTQRTDIAQALGYWVEFGGRK